MDQLTGGKAAANGKFAPQLKLIRPIWPSDLPGTMPGSVRS